MAKSSGGKFVVRGAESFTTELWSKMSDLPKNFYDKKKYYNRRASLSKEERGALEEWAEREGWTRNKSLKKEFDGESMPINLIAPRASDGPGGKYVCVLCGSISTNSVCENCPDTTADEPMQNRTYCPVHAKYHSYGSNFTVHRSIPTVRIA